MGGEGRRGGGRLRESRGEDKVGKEKKEQVIPHIQHAVYMYTVHFYALKHGATAIKLAGTKPLGYPLGAKKVLSKAIWCKSGFPLFQASFTLS